MTAWFRRLALAFGLLGCMSPSAVDRDASGDAPAAPDAPDAAGPPACVGADGLPCLGVGPWPSTAPPNLSCAAVEPGPGLVAPRRLRVVARGTSSVPIPNAAFEVWPGNAVGTTCAPPDCVALTSGADGIATVDLDDGFFAYRVPQNAKAMTYATLGYDRTAPRTGETDVAAIPSALFWTMRCDPGGCPGGWMADPADGIVFGDVSDCDGESMRGVTVRIFDSSDAEIDTSGSRGLNPYIAFRRDGVLVSATLTSTDRSGAFMAGNIPVLPDPRIAIVAYGTAAMDGTRDVIACEEISIGPNAMTLVSLGPYRSDYAAGDLCLGHAPAP